MRERSFGEILLSWRKLLIRLTIAGAVAAVVVSLLLPQWFTASAVLTPPSDNDSGLGLMSVMNQLSSSVGAVGRARSLLKRSPEVDSMIAVLKSRRLRGEVVDRFGLVEHYKAKSREHAIKELGQHLRVDTTPEGFVDVSVEARDRQLAADLTNEFVEALDRYNRSTSVEDAKRTSEFIRTCLDENRTRLDDATRALREFQEQHGAVQIAEQGRVTVEAMADLEAERTRLQIQKGVLQNYALGQQPEIQEIEAQIREIDKRMTNLRGPLPAEVGSHDASKPAPARDGGTKDTEVLLRLRDLPRLALQYAELQREVMVQEKVYEFLTSQLEEARIRESRDLETVKVLDEAVPPIRKTRPRRSLIVILSTLIACTASLGLAFAIEGLADVSASHPALRSARETRWIFGAADAVRRWGHVPAGSEPGSRS